LVVLEQAIQFLKGHVCQPILFDEIDVLGYGIAKDAKLFAYPPLADTGGVQLVDTFDLSHVFLFVRHGPFW